MSEPTARKWVGRYRPKGEGALSIAPRPPIVSTTRTPEDRVGAIASLRRLRFTGAGIHGLEGNKPPHREGANDPGRSARERRSFSYTESLG